MDFNLNTKLEQNLILSQSLRYAIELLTMSSYDLEKEIESESEGNIFIDMMPRNLQSLDQIAILMIILILLIALKIQKKIIGRNS